MSVSRLRVQVALVAVVVVVSACGLPEDRDPQLFALAPRSEQALREVATSTTIGPARTVPQKQYLVRVGGETDESDELAAIEVPVPEMAPAALPKAMLDLLVKGPTTDQHAKDLRSFVPEDAQIESVTVADGIATVTINNLGSIEGGRQRLAAAQIVFTLTELPEVTGVRFIVNGKPGSVPLGNTESSAPGEIIGRDDYPKLSEALAATTPSTESSVPTTPGTPA